LVNRGKKTAPSPGGNHLPLAAAAHRRSYIRSGFPPEGLRFCQP
jgi:hypothetical protein